MAFDFDVNTDMKEWINNTIRNFQEQEEQSSATEDPSSAGQSSIDTYISKLIMKLQLRSQDLSSSIQSSCSTILANLQTNTARELDRVSKDAGELNIALGKLTDNVSAQLLEEGSSDAPQSNPAETLEHLHTINSNLTQCIKLLNEANNWQRLAGEVEAMFATQNLTGVAQHLSAMQQSLGLLEGMPESEKRAAKLEEMQNKLHKLIVPGLRGALESNDDKQLAKFVQVFTQLERFDAIKTEYCSVQCEALDVALEEDWANSAQTFPRFHEKALGRLEAELKRCKEVFGQDPQNALDVITTVVVRAFDAPKLLRSLEAQLETIELGEVVKASKATIQFIDRVIRLLRKHEFEVTQQSHARITKSIARPFLQMYKRYGELQLKSLRRELEAARPKELLAASTAMKEYDHALFVATETAVQHCIEFTFGVDFDGLMKAVSSVWTDHANYLQRCVDSGVDQGFTLGTVLGTLQSISELRGKLVECETAIVDALTKAREATEMTKGEEGVMAIERIIIDEIGSSAHRVVGDATEAVHAALKGSFERLESVIDSAQIVMYEIMLKPIKAEYKSIARMQVWSAKGGKGSAGFGTPLKYMQQITQHIWSLPEQLESYALEASLSRSCLPRWDILGKTERTALEQLLSLEERARHTENIIGKENIELELEGEEQEVDEASGAFVRWWLAVIITGTVNDLLLCVFEQIPELSLEGSTQLAHDFRGLAEFYSKLYNTFYRLPDKFTILQTRSLKWKTPYCSRFKRYCCSQMRN